MFTALQEKIVFNKTRTQYTHKMKKKHKYHNVGTFPKSNIKIVKRGKIGTPIAQIHDHNFLALYRHFNNN